MARRGGLGALALIGLGAGLAVVTKKLLPKAKEYWSESDNEVKRFYDEKVDPLVGKAKETVTPYVDKAKETVSPYVEKAKETVTPYVDRARESFDKFVGHSGGENGADSSCGCGCGESGSAEETAAGVSDEEFRQSESPAE